MLLDCDQETYQYCYVLEMYAEKCKKMISFLCANVFRFRTASLSEKDIEDEKGLDGIRF